MFLYAREVEESYARSYMAYSVDVCNTAPGWGGGGDALPFNDASAKKRYVRPSVRRVVASLTKPFFGRYIHEWGQQLGIWVSARPTLLDNF